MYCIFTYIMSFHHVSNRHVKLCELLFVTCVKFDNQNPNTVSLYKVNLEIYFTTHVLEQKINTCTYIVRYTVLARLFIFGPVFARAGKVNVKLKYVQFVYIPLLFSVGHWMDAHWILQQLSNLWSHWKGKLAKNYSMIIIYSNRVSLLVLSWCIFMFNFYLAEQCGNYSYGRRRMFATRTGKLYYYIYVK
jgi:hypothetical protein